MRGRNPQHMHADPPLSAFIIKVAAFLSGVTACHPL
jgi:hypothetical protein